MDYFTGFQIGTLSSAKAKQLSEHVIFILPKSWCQAMDSDFAGTTESYRRPDRSTRRLH